MCLMQTTVSFTGFLKGWTKTLMLVCPSFWPLNKAFCTQFKDRFANCLGRLIGRKNIFTHGMSCFYLPPPAALTFCFQTG